MFPSATFARAVRICLILLWLIKSSKSISIRFPIIVVALDGARKLVDYIFTQRELDCLDDRMPDLVKRAIEERRNSALPSQEPAKASSRINFSEEMEKTAM